MHSPFDVSVNDVSLFAKTRHNSNNNTPLSRNMTTVNLEAAESDKSENKNASKAPTLPGGSIDKIDDLAACSAGVSCGQPTAVSEYVAFGAVLVLIILFSHNNFGSLFAMALLLTCGLVRMQNVIQHFYTALAVVTLQGAEAKHISVAFVVSAAVTEVFMIRKSVSSLLPSLKSPRRLGSYTHIALFMALIVILCLQVAGFSDEFALAVLDLVAAVVFNFHFFLLVLAFHQQSK